MASSKLVQYNLGHRWSFISKNGCEETRRVDRLDGSKLCVMVYRYMLEKAIDHHLKLHCHGCRFDCLGQLDHMDQGCLMEWDRAVENCILIASKKFSPVDLENAYGKVLEVLQIPEFIPPRLVQDIMKVYSPEIMQESVIAQDDPLEYQEVMQRALGQCLNVFGPITYDD